MSRFEPQNPGFESAVRDSFARQSLMATIGASLTRVAPGEVTIELPHRDGFAQQNGFLHAGIVTAIADTACGYAALTLMPAGKEVLSVEFKLNLLAPAAGGRFIAAATVLRPGRTLTVVRADVHAGETLVATMLATMIGKPGTLAP